MKLVVAVILLLSPPTSAFETKLRGLKINQLHRYPTRASSSTACSAESDKRDSPSGASVRFSGTEATLTNPLDAFLSFVASDVASIALGLIGLLLVVGHRVASLDQEGVESLTVQTRTDLLATFACGSVLLEGITKLDVTSALAEEVILEGFALPSAEFLDSDQQQDEKQSGELIRWGLESLLVATPAKTAVVLGRQSSSSDETSWSVVARSGVVSSVTDIPESTPILKRVGTPGNTKETYLPTLQALPGKAEFPYLPFNTQLALLIPIGENNRRVLVLGGNMAKSFSPRDVTWARIVAERMGNSQ